MLNWKASKHGNTNLFNLTQPLLYFFFVCFQYIIAVPKHTQGREVTRKSCAPTTYVGSVDHRHFQTQGDPTKARKKTPLGLASVASLCYNDSISQPVIS